jgi:hypothetical protein
MYSQMIDDTQKYLSNLKIIMITPFSHVSELTEINIETLTKSIISNCICDTNYQYTDHKLVLSPDQFYIIGLNEDILEDIDKEKLDLHEITYYTLSQIRKKGIKNIIKSIISAIDDEPTHVIFNMASMESNSVPFVSRFTKDYVPFVNGFTINEITEIFSLLQLKLIGLDIVGYNTKINDIHKAHKITCEVAKIPLRFLLKIKEKKINIFNEHSKFIIWRPYTKLSSDDIGWFIMRGLTNDMKEEFLSKLIFDKITFIDILNDDGIKEKILLSATTMDEQDIKSYYDVSTIVTDCVLFPEEKMAACFELVNISSSAT